MYHAIITKYIDEQDEEYFIGRCIEYTIITSGKTVEDVIHSLQILTEKRLKHVKREPTSTVVEYKLISEK